MGGHLRSITFEMLPVYVSPAHDHVPQRMHLRGSRRRNYNTQLPFIAFIQALTLVARAGLGPARPPSVFGMKLSSWGQDRLRVFYEP